MLSLNGTSRMAALAMLALAAACGGAEPAAEAADAATDVAPAAAAQTTPVAEPQDAAAPATGEVIEVRMVMPAGREPRFEPANITAQPGDVVRFVNVENVHNISFPADKNPAGVTLPEPSGFLTQPGATWDYTVALPAGTYNFQCDPHLAMGMTGTLTVTE